MRKEQRKKNIRRESIIKQEKGITLIALVITIIVLLILAAISIATLTGDNGILTKANNAKENTQNTTEEERVKLVVAAAFSGGEGTLTKANVEKEIKKEFGESATLDGGEDGPWIYTGDRKEYEITKNGSLDTWEKVKLLEKGEKATETNKNNYKDSKGKRATIPAEFTVSETDNTIDEGLVVIGPDESEFVWIPVANPVSTNVEDKPMAKVTTGMDSNNRTNYEGILYKFIEPSSGTGASTSSENPNLDGTNYGQGTTSYREPSLVTGSDSDTKALYGENENVVGSDYDAKSDYYSTILGYGDAKKFGKAMQEEYNSMVESVIKYKGFYVGRYEMSLKADTKTAQSKEDVQSSRAFDEDTKMWYGLYSKAKTYSKETIKNKFEKEEKIPVVSGMIWGSQWDAMLNWMQKNGVNVKSNSPDEAIYNNSQKTGKQGDQDKIKNVYDLLGCNCEWTLEAKSASIRIIRGGYCLSNTLPASNRDYINNSNFTGFYSSSRIALYIL